MVLKTLRWLLFVAVALATTACIQSKPPQKLNEPAKVTTAYLLSFPDRPDVAPVPESVANSLVKVLGARNLQPSHVQFEQVSDELERRRETRDRLEVIAAGSDAPFVLLVETRVRFYSLLTGRFRWDVDGRVTIAPRGDLGRAQTDEFSFAAFLEFEHQDEADALRFVEQSMSERVGLAVDRFLRGREGGEATMPTPEQAPQPSTSTEEAGAEGESPPFDAGDAIYFVMLDRFHNGVPGNDQTTDPADPQAWHGGDIAGLTQKLDYLKSLGITHVWASPVWDARDAKFHGHGAFHGYWTEQLDAVEPRLGTEAELVALAKAMREREMGLLLDMVLNHVGPGAPLVAEKPDWFHGHGGITDWSDARQITDFDVHGLPDLDQDNPEVYAHLFDTSVRWSQKLQPAGFRLDAVKHVSNDFWTKYNGAIAQKFGEDFVMLGEVLDGNPRVTAEAMREGKFNALFDFPLHFALVDVFCRDAHPGRIGAVLAADRLYPEALRSAHRRGLVTLLDNHDLPRVVSVCGDEVSRVENALTMMLSLRGTPSFTWGTELPLAGASEPANRADMDFGAEQKLGRQMKRLLEQRRTHRVLVDGRDQVVALDEKTLVLARVLPDAAAIIVLDRSGRDAVSAPGWFKGTPTVGNFRKGMVMTGGERVSLTVTYGDFSEVYESLDTPARREILVKVDGAPGKARLAGSAPEVGAWQYAGAVPVQEGEVRVSMPVGEVVALKIATVVDGKEVWEQRADRFVLVEPGEKPLELEISWEK